MKKSLNKRNGSKRSNKKVGGAFSIADDFIENEDDWVARAEEQRRSDQARSDPAYWAAIDREERELAEAHMRSHWAAIGRPVPAYILRRLEAGHRPGDGPAAGPAAGAATPATAVAPAPALATEATKMRDDMLEYIQIRNKSREFARIYNTYKKEICSICLDQLLSDKLPTSAEDDDSLNITVLVCGHTFHQKCIEEWTRTDRTAATEKCPLGCVRPAVNRATGRRDGETTGGGKSNRKIKRSKSAKKNKKTNK